MKKIALAMGLAAAMIALVLACGNWAGARAARGTTPPEGRSAQAAFGDVVINEVAWMGTANSDWDEWVELYNNTNSGINLTNWTLTSTGSINVLLNGTIPAGGYFLLERNDRAVNDVSAEQVYGGQRMGNGGEVLVLRDDLGNLVDTANAGTGHGNGWAAGTNGPDHTMERINPTAPDTTDNWATNDGLTRNGHDASDDPINGTPKAQNSRYAIPGLTIDKTGPDIVTSGFTFTSHIAVSNTSHSSVGGVVVTDTLPSELAFIAQASPFSFEQPATDTLVWQVGALSPGALRFITLTLRVPETITGTATNVVTATDDTGRTEVATWSVPLVPYVRLYALHPHALMYDTSDEAAALVNMGTVTASLTGWRLGDGDLASNDPKLPDTTLPPGEVVWLTHHADDFYHVFGFDANLAVTYTTRAVPLLDGSWPGLTNSGEQALLFDGQGNVIDTLVYGSGDVTTVGWNGAAVPYPRSGFGAGQVVYRKLDQATGRPTPDTDTAADWAQATDDDINGKKVRFPGWDTEAFFFPAQVTHTAALTVWVAPDGLYEGIAGALERARSSILIEGYTFDNAALVGVITHVLTIRPSVAVTVLLEGRKEDETLRACRQMADAGAHIYFMHNEDAAKIFQRYNAQHAKFIIVDGKTVFLGSENFSPGGMPADPKADGTWGHRGVYLATDAPGAVARVQAIFDRDLDLTHSDIVPWGSHGYTATTAFTPTVANPMTYTARFSQPLALAGTFAFEVVHSPENSLRDSDALLGLLSRAGSGDTVLVEQLYEHRFWGSGTADDPNPRLEAYIAAARRGATVRLLLDSLYDDGSNQSTADYANGIAHGEGLDLEARLGNPTGDGIHNKMILAHIGGQGYIHVGSINGSEVSSKVNRELALQVQSNEAYEFLKGVFDYDWQASWQSSPGVTQVYLPLLARNHVPPADHLVISELLYDPTGVDDAHGEWIEIHNPTAITVTLDGYRLSDGESYGDGTATFPAGSHIAPGGVVVVAQTAGGVGFVPDYELTDTDPAVPNLTPVSGSIGWGNSGDEAILRDATGADVDVVVYGSGSYAGVTPHPGVGPGNSLERKPAGRDTDDCSADFWERYAPNPGQVETRLR